MENNNTLLLPDFDRFYNGEDATFADGSQELTAPTFLLPENTQFTVAAINIGMEITELANKQYSKKVEQAGKYWWVLCETNNIDKPWELDNFAGQTLLVPDILNFLINR